MILAITVFFSNLLTCCTYVTGCVIRSSIVRNRIAGGMGQLFKIFNELFFGRPHAADLRLGVQLPYPSMSVDPEFKLVFGGVDMLIQDGDAHAAVLDWRTAGGTKPCFKCLNIVKKNSKYQGDTTGTYKPLWTLDTAELKLNNDRLFGAMLRRLRYEGENNPDGLGDMEKEYGFNLNIHSWLHSPGLDIKPMKIACYDSMHCSVEGGFWDEELECCVGRLSKFGYGSASLHSYLQLFQWPRAYASGKDICKSSTVHRAKERETKPNGSASEILSAAPVVCKWLRDVIPDDVCPLEKQSAFAACHVLDLIQKAETGEVTPEQLRKAIYDWGEKHLQAYGTTLWKPKFHWILHLPQQLEDHGTLQPCYVHERKHKVVKRWAVPCTSKISYEIGLLEECTLQHLHALKDPLERPAVKDPVPAFPKMVEALKEAGFANDDDVVLSTLNMTVRSRSIRVGDVCTYQLDGHGVGFAEIFFHSSVNGVCLTCLSDWPIVSKSDYYWKATVREHCIIVDSDRLLHSVVFTPTTVGKTSTIIMPCVYS